MGVLIRAFVFRPSILLLDVVLRLVRGLRFPHNESESWRSTVGMMIDVLFNRYEKEVVRVFLSYVKPGMLCIDIGAHLGFHTLMLAKLVGPQGLVVAFEPSPENFQALSWNIRRRRNMHNVIIEPRAVLDREGIILLSYGATSGGNTTVQACTKTIEVECISLDKYLQERGLGLPDLIKIDAEGVEPMVCRGMKELLAAADKLNIIFEFHPKLWAASGNDLGEVLHFLWQRGFYVYEISQNGELRLLGDVANYMRSLKSHVNLLARKVREGGN